MNTFVDAVSQFELFQRIGWGLIHSLWQIAILAGVYLLVRVLIPQKRIAFRYRFGFGILLLMLLVPVTTLFLIPPAVEKTTPLEIEDSPESFMPVKQHKGPLIVSYEEFMRDHVGPDDVITEVGDDGTMISVRPPQLARGVNAVLPAPYEAGSRAQWRDFLTSSLWLITIVWLLGVIVLSLRLSSGLLGIQKLRRSGEDDIPEDWTDRLSRLCEKLRVKQTVRLFSSRAIDSPVLIGVFRPVILLPMSLLSGFTPEEVEAILAHELAHIRRHDYLANLVQMIIETLLFYHPLLWWVSNAIREDREYICDDFAVHGADVDSLVYAKTLTHLEQFRQNGGKPMKRTLPTPAAAAKPLLARIRRVLGLKKESERSSGWLAGVTLSILLLVTPVTLALMQPPENTPSMTDSIATEPAENPTLFSEANPVSPSAFLSPDAPQQQSMLPPQTFPSSVIEGTPGRTKVTSGKPVTSRLYPIGNVLELFVMPEFIAFLQTRLNLENLEDPYQIFPTRKNAIIMIGTEDLHQAIEKIMLELDDIVSGSAFQGESTVWQQEIKVYRIKNTHCSGILNSLQHFFNDSTVILSMEPVTNQILLKADQKSHEKIAELIKQLDLEPPHPPQNADMGGGGIGMSGYGGMSGGGGPRSNDGLDSIRAWRVIDGD